MGLSGSMVNMSAVWDRTIEFVSDNLAGLMPLVIGGILVPLTINDALAPLSVGAGPGLRAGLGMASLVLVLIVLWARLAVIAMALNPERTGGEAARRALASLLPTILVSLIVLVLCALLFAPILLILALYGYDFASAMQGSGAQAEPAAIAWSALYVLVVLPLLAWIGARLALLNPVIVAEGLGLSAFGRSVALTRGLAFKIIGVAILFVVMSLVIELAVKAGLGTVIHLLVGDDGAVSAASVLTSVFVAAAGTVLTVLASAFLAKLYLAACARETAGMAG